MTVLSKMLSYRQTVDCDRRSHFTAALAVKEKEQILNIKVYLSMEPLKRQFYKVLLFKSMEWAIKCNDRTYSTTL